MTVGQAKQYNDMVANTVRMQELVDAGVDPMEMTPEMQELFFKKAWKGIKKVGSSIGKVAKDATKVVG